MFIINEKLRKAVKSLRFIRRYSPYKYGGTWFITQMNDKKDPYTVFYRTKKAILKTGNKEIYKIQA